MPDDQTVAPALLLALRARRDEVAERWYVAIARTSFSPRRAQQVRAELLALTDRAIDALVGESFDVAAANAVGEGLARLHYLNPAALEAMLRILGEDLVSGVPPEVRVALQPRVTAVLGAAASGFFAIARAMILEEQDQIRRALFVTRQQADAAEEARAVAEEAVRVRTEVLHAAAHDLRGPVTTIMGQADLLRRRLDRDASPPADWLQTRAAAIREGALRIRGMIEELLDVARLQSGQQLALHIESVDVAELVAQVVRPRESSDGRAGSRVAVDAEPGLIVDADRARLLRVVENLVDNAIKYSPGATPVEVGVRRHGDGVQIVVRDRGVGIPADELPHLFTPYYRATTARGVRGIGIGLAGAKSIVEQHGGRISVESAVGAGTTVVVSLLSAPPQAQAS